MKEEDLPQLTAEEEKAAILEWRLKKYYKLKFADYWIEAEKKRGPVRQLNQKSNENNS